VRRSSASPLPRLWQGPSRRKGEDGAFFDDETPDGLVGREALSEYIAGTHEEMPGLVITETSEPQILGNRLRVPWVARQGDTQMCTGTDFVEFAEDGRVSRVTMFYDSTVWPSRKQTTTREHSGESLHVESSA
jgi:hypothetical protein